MGSLPLSAGGSVAASPGLAQGASRRPARSKARPLRPLERARARRGPVSDKAGYDVQPEQQDRQPPLCDPGLGGPASLPAVSAGSGQNSKGRLLFGRRQNLQAVSPQSALQGERPQAADQDLSPRQVFGEGPAEPDQGLSVRAGRGAKEERKKVRHQGGAQGDQVSVRNLSGHGLRLQHGQERAREAAHLRSGRHGAPALAGSGHDRKPGGGGETLRAVRGLHGHRVVHSASRPESARRPGHGSPARRSRRVRPGGALSKNTKASHDFAPRQSHAGLGARRVCGRVRL